MPSAQQRKTINNERPTGWEEIFANCDKSRYLEYIRNSKDTITLSKNP